MKHIINHENRALLKELVRTDFKLRYQGSILGYAWSLLRPLFLFLILYIVFVKFLKFKGDIPYYSIYLLLGIVLWSFFSEMTSQSLSSIVNRGDLIRKIRIPRWIIVLSSSISTLINLFLNLTIVAVFMIFAKVNLSQTLAWFPLLLLQIYLLSLGVSLFLAAAYVKYRDISYIWEVILQAAFYVTPILYPLSLIVNPTYQKILLLNPMAQIIQDARYAVVTHVTPTTQTVFGHNLARITTISITIIVLCVGILYFKRHAKYFAEDL